MNSTRFVEHLDSIWNLSSQGSYCLIDFIFLAALEVDHRTVSKSDWRIHSNSLASSSLKSSAMICGMQYHTKQHRRINNSIQTDNSTTAFFCVNVSIEQFIDRFSEWNTDIFIFSTIYEHSCCSNTFCYHGHLCQCFFNR